MGDRVETLPWTQGRYDLVAIIEAPDAQAIAATRPRTGMVRGTRPETPQTVDDAAMASILAKIG